MQVPRLAPASRATLTAVCCSPSPTTSTAHEVIGKGTPHQLDSHALVPSNFISKRKERDQHRHDLFPAEAARPDALFFGLSTSGTVLSANMLFISLRAATTSAPSNPVTFL